MNKKIKEQTKWILRSVAFLFTLAAGFGGYYEYYAQAISLRELSGPVFAQSLFSTIRLFAASFDLDYAIAEKLNHGTLLIGVLETAKWVAILLTGNVIFKIIRPFLSKFFVASRQWRWLRAKRGILIVGNNDENKMIYRSAPQRVACALLVDDVQQSELLHEQNIKAVAAKNAVSANQEELIRYFEKKTNRAITRAIAQKKECTIIINTQDEQNNLHIAQSAAACVRTQLEKRYAFLCSEETPGAREQQEIVDILNNIRIFVFGERTYQAVYLSLQKDSFGILKYLNKYHMTAVDFVNEHTFLEHMREDVFRKYVKNGCISKDLALNTVLVGFGQTNREMLSVSFANQQFVEKEPGGIAQLKKVNYHIFDLAQNSFDKNLNNSLFRFKNEFSYALAEGMTDKDDYFDLPAFPANIHYYAMNVYEEAFYRQLGKICRADGASETQVIISVGNDLENMDIAHRLAAKKAEWGLENVHIYAKVSQNLTNEISTLLRTKEYQVFGNEEQLVFHYKKILRDDMEELAIQRNLMYEYEQARKQNKKVSPGALEISERYHWYVTMDSIKRLSNIYSILSLRLKLQLMGLDYAAGELPSGAGKVIGSNDAYFRIYAGEHPPQVAVPAGNASQKDIYSYHTLAQKADFCADDIRQNLTVQEHYRWNALMIAEGFVPQSKTDAFKTGAKDYINRRHSNLSTFEGLFDFRKEMAEHRGTSEGQEDVIQYDYQLMDDAWWFLHSKHYEVFERWQSEKQ